MHRQTLNIDKCSVNGIEVSESSEIPEKHVSVYPYFVRDSIPRLLDEELHSVIKKYDELCYYVGPERELYASYTMLSFYHHMVPPEKFTQENFKIRQSISLVLGNDDDVMDEHGYRWMRPAYYTLPGVNTKVVLESKKLYLSAFHVLKKHFKNHMYYRQMLELFLTTCGTFMETTKCLEKLAPTYGGRNARGPIIAAIKHANKEQLILLKENYGIKDEKCENVVKSVFRELDLIQKFLSFKQNLLAEVERDIKCIPHEDIPEKHISLYPYIIKDSIPRNFDKEFYQVIKNFDQLCYQTGPDRELYPSYVLISFYQHLRFPNALTEEEFKSASILAWSLEMTSTGFILDDDVMDRQEYRWMRPTYFTNSNVGLKVVLDSKKMYLSSVQILKKHFKKHKYYRQLLELAYNHIHFTSYGQTLGFTCAHQFTTTRNLSLYTEKTYRNIIKYKTEVPLYIVPPHSAMYLAEIDDLELRKCFSAVFSKFSYYRTVQDDMLDVYGAYELYGKKCSDISSSQCTWLIINAIKHSNKMQLKLLENNYGKKNDVCENVVKNVFRELDLIRLFWNFKQYFMEEVKREIELIPHEGIKRVCYEHIERYIDIDEKMSYD
ncbi:hypothetical protein FQA39_LY16126 [Lamprigera yunnana]|nr:hypothetical protein FQA39_LY16126 [Lamprigera yunnana]